MYLVSFVVRNMSNNIITQKRYRSKTILNLGRKGNVRNKPKEMLTETFNYLFMPHNCGDNMMEVYINGVKICRDYPTTQVFNVISALNLMEIRDVHSVVLEAYPDCASLSDSDLQQYSISFSPDCLHNHGKKAHQSHFDFENKSNPYIACTPLSDKKTPAFMPRRGYMTVSGKYDNLSTVRPMAIEFKSLSHKFKKRKSIEAEMNPRFCTILDNEDWSVLHQSIERVMVERSIHQLHRNTAVFAVSDNHCWLVWLSKLFIEGSESQLTEKMHVMHIAMNEFPRLWASLTKEAVLHPELLYTGPMTSHVYKVIRHFSPHVGFVGTAVIGASHSWVIDVCFPQYHDSTVVIDTDSKHYALKILSSNELFEREVAVAKHMTNFLKHSNKKEAKEFYALGYMAASDETPTFFSKYGEQFAESIKTGMMRLSGILCSHTTVQASAEGGAVMRVPWWEQMPEHPTVGGVLIMRCANYKVDRSTMAEYRVNVLDGVLSSVRHTHASGLVHRDVRIRNVMHFDPPASEFQFSWEKKRPWNLTTGWRLVDYGIAGIPCVKASDATRMLRATAAAVGVEGVEEARFSEESDSDSDIYDDEQGEEEEDCFDRYCSEVVESSSVDKASDDDSNDDADEKEEDNSPVLKKQRMGEREPNTEEENKDHVEDEEIDSEGDDEYNEDRTSAVERPGDVLHNAYGVCEGSIIISRDSGQYDGAGWSVRQKGGDGSRYARGEKTSVPWKRSLEFLRQPSKPPEDFTYYWTYADDYEMVMAMYQELEEINRRGL